MLLDHPQRVFPEASNQVGVVVGCGGLHHHLCVGLWPSCFLKLFRASTVLFRLLFILVCFLCVMPTVVINSLIS
jgi:hypothetical protein